MRGVLGALLMVGLLAGCGGVEGGAEPSAAPAESAAGEVQAMACSDCSWLWLRCMRGAPTAEAQAECDASRALCEETFCTYGVGGVESFQRVPTSCFTSEGCGPNELCCLDGTNPMGYCALVCREMPIPVD